MPATAAVLYLRVSTDKQETSIDQQRTELHAYAAKHGYTIVREYLDEGISGDATEKRRAFQRMLRDTSERADFKVVLCWDQDRFGRFDPLEAGYWIKPLRDAGVRLETVAQGKIDWNDFAGRLIYAVQQEAKHAFLRDLSRNVVRGMAARAREGAWQGQPPYGCVLRDGKLALGDPEKVAVVQWLFHTYATTLTSLGELARQLNERGVPAPEGGKWHKTTVHKVLTRRQYCGSIVWNVRHCAKYNELTGGEIRPKTTKQRGVPIKDAKDWIVVPEAHGALIDQATFDAVQVRLESNRQHKTPHMGGGCFLFTRLLFCMHCGGPMHGLTNVQRKEGRTYAYRRYICGKYNSFGKAGCACNTITERQLTNAVLQRVQQDFLNPANLKLLEKELRRKLAARRRVDPARSKLLQARVAELGKQLEQGSKNLALVPPDLMDGVVKQMYAWRDERDRLQAELFADGTNGATEADDAAKVELCIKTLWTLHEQWQADQPSRFRQVVEQAVARIECWFQHVPYGNKGRTRSELTHGLIHLRPDLLVHRDVPQGRPLITV